MDNLTLPRFPCPDPGFSEEAGAPETELLPDVPQVAAEARLAGAMVHGFDFNMYFFTCGFPPFSFFFSLPCPFPLGSRRYIWIFQPGKKFFNVMIMAGSRRWGGGGGWGGGDRQIPIDMKTSPDELVISA